MDALRLPQTELMNSGNTANATDLPSPVSGLGKPRATGSFAISILISLMISVLPPARSHAGRDDDGQQAVEITSPQQVPQQEEEPVPPGRVGRKYFSPKTGRQAAAKYMAPSRPEVKSDEDATAEPARGPAAASSDHYMALHVGWFVNDSVYKFGTPDSQNNVGRWNFGLTYRMGEWVNSMDLLFRFDVARLALAEGSVTKFSVMPMITFPDASSRFPLYFGAGVGLGIFGNQIQGESTVALDYSIVAGARFFNLWGQTGLVVEGGIKNHLHLLSDGQFNGTFISSGFVFTF